MGYPYDDNPPNWNDLNVQFDLGMARGDARRAEREAREAWETAQSWQNHAQKLEQRLKQEETARQALVQKLQHSEASRRQQESRLADKDKLLLFVSDSSEQQRALADALRKENQELREAIQQGAKQRRIARCQINELINNVAGELWDLAYPEKSDPNVEANVAEFTELIEEAMRRGKIAGQENKDQAAAQSMEDTLPHE